MTVLQHFHRLCSRMVSRIWFEKFELKVWLRYFWIDVSGFCARFYKRYFLQNFIKILPEKFAFFTKTQGKVDFFSFYFILKLSWKHLILIRNSKIRCDSKKNIYIFETINSIPKQFLISKSQCDFKIWKKNRIIFSISNFNFKLEL